MNGEAIQAGYGGQSLPSPEISTNGNGPADTLLGLPVTGMDLFLLIAGALLIISIGIILNKLLEED